jgi:hypothetical protein
MSRSSITTVGCIFWVTKEAPYVIKLVNIIPKGKWVTVTVSMI